MSAIDDYKKLQQRENAGAVLLPPHKSDDRTASQRADDLKASNAEAKANRQKAVDLGLSPRGGRRAVERRIAQAEAGIGAFISRCLNKNRLVDLVQRLPGGRNSVSTVASSILGEGGRGPKRPPQWLLAQEMGGDLDPYEIFPFNAGTSEVPDWKIKMTPSVINSEIADSPAQEADLNYLFSPGSGLTYVWAHITVDQTNGEFSGRTLHSGSSVPTNTDTDRYETIGGCFVSSPTTAPNVFNFRFGPITFRACRNWFAETTPFYGIDVL